MGLILTFLNIDHIVIILNDIKILRIIFKIYNDQYKGYLNMDCMKELILLIHTIIL